MANAITAATWFVWKNDARKKELESDDFGEYEDITHLKLQKLLYYAQGLSLAMEGTVLFPEKILAWKHGPVVAEVYDELKMFGKRPVIIQPAELNVSCIKALTSRENEILDLTYDNFAIFTAWQLRNMTHEDGSPWDVTIRTKGLNSEIGTDLIKNYFLRNVVEDE